MVLTGVQAIARALVEQHERDARAGLRVATFVSGYQGSPLGGVDRMLAGMPDVLQAHDITFVPGLNEELAATSVWGSQADLAMFSEGTAPYDGVVGVWYGKGPGLDRATDAIRHANMYGANPRGGMLLLVGDDPASKSSTVPAVSERSLAALGIPVLFPRNAREIVTMTMHGVALSRASGCVVALKIVADVADGAWSVDVARRRCRHRRTRNTLGGKTVRLPPAADGGPGRQPGRRGRPVRTTGATIVRAYGAANGLDVVEIDPPEATHRDRRHGTRHSTRCGRRWPISALDDFALHRAGIRLLRIGMPHPARARHRDGLRRRSRRNPRRRGQDARSSRPRCAKSSTAERVHRGSSARRTPPDGC